MPASEFCNVVCETEDPVAQNRISEVPIRPATKSLCNRSSWIRQPRTQNAQKSHRNLCVGIRNLFAASDDLHESFKDFRREDRGKVKLVARVQQSQFGRQRISVCPLHQGRRKGDFLDLCQSIFEFQRHERGGTLHDFVFLALPSFPQITFGKAIFLGLVKNVENNRFDEGGSSMSGKVVRAMASSGLVEKTLSSPEAAKVVELPASAVLIVDGYYAFKGARKISGGRNTLCAQKLADFVNDRLLRPSQARLLDKFWMDSTPEPVDPRDRARITALQNLGYQCPEFRYKKMSREVSCPSDGRVFRVDFTVQAGVDVGIALLAAKCVAFAKEPITDAVLVAGDGDFAPAIQLMRDSGKRVWLLSYRNSFSSKLGSLVGARFHFLDDVFEQISRSSEEFRTAPSRSGRGAANCARGNAIAAAPKIIRKPGDWDCPACGSHNFASRSACFFCAK